MLIRHATHNDHAEWLRLRSTLWPDCPLDDHHSEMQEQLDDQARNAVYVIERDTGKLGGFLEASLRAYADGCRTSPVGYIEGWYVDADLKTAVIDCARRSFRNTGQICNSVNRIFVHESLAAPFVEQLVEATRKMVVGNGLEKPNVDLGPMVNQEGVDRTLRHIQDAVGRGARLLCGGTRPSGEEFGKGFYLEPAVLDRVPPEALIMNEETFGPAVAVASFSTLDQAIEKANATRYGLVAYAYTKDLGTVQALINRLDFGTVCVNNTAAASYQAPYGGWKDSGLGVELSHHAMDEYLRLKHVRIQS